jgi:hypothetical protein
LACLPYAYILGQPKCGTTDLFDRLRRHPDIRMPRQKEVRWFTRGEFTDTPLIPDGEEVPRPLPGQQGHRGSKGKRSTLYCWAVLLYLYLLFLYVDSLTYTFGWSLFLCRIRFRDTLVVTFFTILSVRHVRG